MSLAIKAAITLGVVLGCTFLGRKVPSLAGLIAVMPLTGLLVLFWIHHENSGASDTLLRYTRGALWGILPTILFYAVALVCLERRLSFAVSLLAATAVWILAAVVHQVIIK